MGVPHGRIHRRYLEKKFQGSTAPLGFNFGQQIMSMTAKVLSINALATELDRDRRTIAKALRHVPPDGETSSGREGWYLRTAARALEFVEDRRRQDGGSPNPQLAAQLMELERAGERCQKLLDDLVAEPDVEQRRTMVHNGRGACIGALMTAFDRLHVGRSDGAHKFERMVSDMICGRVVDDVFELCRWRLAVDDAEAA
jgi:hypothetical protein